MLLRKLYYATKPLIPRSTQIMLRRQMVLRKRLRHASSWPIDPMAAEKPGNWSGWPENKRFAFIITHDVESQLGHDRCMQLKDMEAERGFCASYNFVPERYTVSKTVRDNLTSAGFEVGVHGLNHDGRLYNSRKEFQRRAVRINYYLEEWEALGFRSPAMHRNFDWIHDLNILYDASSFDTDPFEPMSEGVGTIFPFEVRRSDGSAYIELPYTLPQDFTLFVLMGETNINIWKSKLDWIAQNGGVALINVHPDYLYFGNEERRLEEFPVEWYLELLDYVKLRYSNQYWHALPKDLALFWRGMLHDSQPNYQHSIIG